MRYLRMTNESHASLFAHSPQKADKSRALLVSESGARVIQVYRCIIGISMSTRAVEIDDQQAMSISRALADPKRFEMLEKIGKSKEAPTCSCVCEWTGLAPATVSHHLKELENAGLVTVERNGKFAYLKLRRDVLNGYLKRLSAL